MGLCAHKWSACALLQDLSAAGLAKSDKQLAESKEFQVCAAVGHKLRLVLHPTALAKPSCALPAQALFAKYSKPASDESVEKTVKAFVAKGHKAVVVNSKEEAVKYLQSLAPEGASVCSGCKLQAAVAVALAHFPILVCIADSTTLHEIGFVDYLKNQSKWKDLKVWWPHDADRVRLNCLSPERHRDCHEQERLEGRWRSSQAGAFCVLLLLLESFADSDFE